MLRKIGVHTDENKRQNVSDFKFLGWCGFGGPKRKFLTGSEEVSSSTVGGSLLGPRGSLRQAPARARAY